MQVAASLLDPRLSRGSGISGKVFSSMTEQDIACDTHGNQRTAFVCHHILQSIQDRQPRGFIWGRDEEGCVNAYCDECEGYLESHGGEWNEITEAFADIKLVCEGCAIEAAQLNGIAIDQ